MFGTMRLPFYTRKGLWNGFFLFCLTCLNREK